MIRKPIITALFFTISTTLCWAQTNTFPNSGNVGIGTTSPISELEVRGNITTSGFFRTLNPNNNDAFVFMGWSNEVARQRIGGNGVGAGNGLDIQSVGDKSIMRFLHNGNVGIGTTAPTERLSVNGNIRAKEVKVEMTNWPDYVFQEDYALLSLDDLNTYIKENGHLPGIPTAKDVEADGVALAEMNRKLLEKVEELTLHLIEKEHSEKRIQERLDEQDILISRILKQFQLQ